MVTSQPATEKASRTKSLVLLAMAILILVPSMLGFAAKFIEFIHTFQGAPEGIFAITPIVNYLLASIGFFCMLIWATANGMFHDMERPKYLMLEREWALERQRSGVSDDDRPGSNGDCHRRPVPRLCG